MGNERILVSLAILKVNWDKKHDYLENFMPFIKECLRTQEEAIVSLDNSLYDRGNLLKHTDPSVQTLAKKITQGMIAQEIH